MRELPDDVIEQIRSDTAGSPMVAHVDAMVPHVRPCVSIRIDEEPLRNPRHGGTQIRGLPDVPPGWEWPTRNGAPLTLLAQFDCEEFKPVDYFKQLPHAGVLSFFYDLLDRPWGDEADARSAAVVQYFPDSSALRRADSDDATEAYGMKLFQTWEVPSQSRWFNRRFGHLSDDQQFNDYAYYLEDVVADGILPIDAHQLLGYATREQSHDIELQCELRHRGLKELSKNNSSYPVIDRAADDWILLAQFAWDDERLTHEFGSGYIYYFIRRQDLREKRFDPIQVAFEIS
jgi:uncharacterized protein YwqG